MRLLSSLNQKISVILLTVLVAGCTELSESVTEPIKSPLTYVDDMQPIFERSCVRCHGGQATQGYDLSNYASAMVKITRGDPNSTLVLRTRKTGETDEMYMYQYLNSPEEADMIYNWVVLDSAAKE